jgi:NAD(P)-dependent dehydrogenase (short-subunit alcohol dehydrogenase family)
VGCLNSGIINTPQVVSIEAQQGDAAAANLFGQGAPGALGRRGEAGEVADLIVYLLSPQSSFINGVAVPIEGGWTCSV